MKRRNDAPGWRCPDWYWERGLHDAQILLVTERVLPSDPRQNCLEICLDSHDVMLDRTARCIRLYTYTIETPEWCFESAERLWWIRDTLKPLPDNRYRLKIGMETARGKHRALVVTFKSAAVERGETA